MNERIKELINQATVRSEEYLPGNDGHPTPTVYFDKEKFAELIVKECLTVITPTEHDTGSYVDFSNGLKLARVRIKKHFGVE